MAIPVPGGVACIFETASGPDARTLRSCRPVRRSALDSSIPVCHAGPDVSALRPPVFPNGPTRHRRVASLRRVAHPARRRSVPGSVSSSTRAARPARGGVHLHRRSHAPSARRAAAGRPCGPPPGDRRPASVGRGTVPDRHVGLSLASGSGYSFASNHRAVSGPLTCFRVATMPSSVPTSLRCRRCRNARKVASPTRVWS